jgi:hypothetical protein
VANLMWFIVEQTVRIVSATLEDLNMYRVALGIHTKSIGFFETRTTGGIFWYSLSDSWTQVLSG